MCSHNLPCTLALIKIIIRSGQEIGVTYACQDARWKPNAGLRARLVCYLSVILTSVCVCVCVCVREREREILMHQQDDHRPPGSCNLFPGMRMCLSYGNPAATWNSLRLSERCFFLFGFVLFFFPTGLDGGNERGSAFSQISSIKTRLCSSSTPAVVIWMCDFAKWKAAAGVLTCHPNPQIHFCGGNTQTHRANIKIYLYLDFDTSSCVCVCVCVCFFYTHGCVFWMFRV